MNKWKSIDPMARVWVALALGLACASTLWMLTTLGPDAVLWVRTAFVHMDKRGIDVSTTIANIQIGMLFIGVALQAHLQLSSHARKRTHQRTLYALLQAGTVVNMLLAILTIRLADPVDHPGQLLSMALAVASVFTYLGFCAYQFFTDNAEVTFPQTYYGLTAQMATVPTALIVLISGAWSTVGVYVGLGLMLYLLRESAAAKSAGVQLAKNC